MSIVYLMLGCVPCLLLTTCPMSLIVNEYLTVTSCFHCVAASSLPTTDSFPLSLSLSLWPGLEQLPSLCAAARAAMEKCTAKVKAKGQQHPPSSQQQQQPHRFSHQRVSMSSGNGSGGSPPPSTPPFYLPMMEIW